MGQANFKIIQDESSFDNDTNTLRVKIQNTGGEVTTGKAFTDAESNDIISDYHRIIELTDDENKATDFGIFKGFQGDHYIEKNGKKFYPMAPMTNYPYIDEDNSWLDEAKYSMILLDKESDACLGVVTNPVLGAEAGDDAITLILKFKDGKLEDGKTYAFCADDVMNDIDDSGDTVEPNEFDNLPMNTSDNYFVFTVGEEEESVDFFGFAAVLVIILLGFLYGLFFFFGKRKMFRKKFLRNLLIKKPKKFIRRLSIKKSKKFIRRLTIKKSKKFLRNLSIKKSLGLVRRKLKRN
jgi:hypothetical protein